MSWFWWFMLAMVLLLPAALILCGLFWWVLGRVPQFRGAVGYKTARSMKTPAAWVFAHKYFGRIAFIAGIALAVGGVVVMLFCLGKDEDTIGITGAIVNGVQTLGLIAPIIPTEIALKRNF
ncbi:MAG: SdpI family protein [Oscillospiraceae bacterium]|nr:SdpI family protein [Oscillospiraceae bacterium]